MRKVIAILILALAASIPAGAQSFGQAWFYGGASGVGGGVTSVNTLTGAVVLAAGTNITLTPSGNTITVASTAGGTTTNQTKYGISANASGTATAVDSVVCTPPATVGVFVAEYQNPTAAATAPGCPQVGLAARSDVATSASPIVAADTAAGDIVYAAATAAAVPVPTPTTLANLNPVFATDNALTAGAVTFTPTTLTVNGGSTLVMQQEQHCLWMINPALSTDWFVPCVDRAGFLNGVAVPASAAVLGSNSSSQPIAATPHQVALPLVCADTSSSSTTYTCTTTPTMGALTAGDSFRLTAANQANSGAATLNIDAIGAKALQKWQGTALAAGDLAAGKAVDLVYDGTALQVMTIGNAPSGGSSAFPLTITGGASGAVPCFTSTTVESAGTLLASNALVLGGGSGVCPSTSANFGVSAGQLNIGAVGTQGILGLVGTTSGTATITGPAVAGTSTNPFVFSNILNVPAGSKTNPSLANGNNGGCWFPSANIIECGGGGADGTRFQSGSTENASGVPYCFDSTTNFSGSIDTCISRLAAGFLAVGVSNSVGNAAGILVDGNKTFVTADFTDSTSATLMAITGLTWTLPTSKAVNVSFHCSLFFDQATAAVSDSFGVGVTGTAPTNLNAGGIAYSGGSGVATVGTLSNLATTTPTAVVTFTPSAITTIWNASLDGTVEQPSNATPGVFNIYASTTTGTDNLIVKRGSYCSLF